jgi:hypothetical protein
VESTVAEQSVCGFDPMLVGSVTRQRPAQRSEPKLSAGDEPTYGSPDSFAPPLVNLYEAAIKLVL